MLSVLICTIVTVHSFNLVAGQEHQTRPHELNLTPCMIALLPIAMDDSTTNSWTTLTCMLTIMAHRIVHVLSV